MTLHKVCRWIIYIGIGVLLLTPFIVTNSMFFPFITGKAFTFRIVTEIMFAAWLILMLYDQSARPQSSWVLYAVAAFVVVPLGGVLFGVNTADAIWSNFERMIGWITILHFGALFMVAAHTVKPKHWRWFLYFSLAVSVIVGLQGLAEIGSGERIDSTLGNPIYLAMYSLFHAFLAGYFLVARIKRAVQKQLSLLADWQVYLMTALGACNIVVLWFTGTRGAIVGLLVGLFVTTLLVAIFQYNRPTVRKVAMAGVILPVLAVGLFFGFRDTKFVQESPVLGRFARIQLDEGTAGTRLEIWQMGLEGYADRPVFGWGMGNFNYVFDRYYKPSLQDATEWFDRAHNVLVEWLVAAGSLGVLAYLSLFAAVFWLIWKPPRRGDAWSIPERAVLIGLLVSYLVQNLFVFDHLTSYILFALVLAWIHARSGSGKLWERLPVSVSRSAKTWTAFGISLAMLVLIYAWNYPGLRQATMIIDGLQQTAKARQLHKSGRKKIANRLHKQGLQTFRDAIAIDAMGTQEAREQLRKEAIRLAQDVGPQASIAKKYQKVTSKNYQKQLQAEPKDMRHNVLYGDFLLTYGEYDKAVDQYQAAAKISNYKKQSVLFSLAQAYQLSGQTEKSLETYKRAFELPTDFRTTIIRYASALARSERIDKAKSVLKQEFGTAVVSTTTSSSNRLLRAYKRAGYTEGMIKILKQRVNYIKQTKKDIDVQTAAQTYASLAAAYHQAGRTQEAIATLQTLKQKYPATARQVNAMIDRLQAGKDITATPGG